MTFMAAIRQDMAARPPVAEQASFQGGASQSPGAGQSNVSGQSNGSGIAVSSVLDRLLAPPSGELTPVQLGEAARERDLARAAGDAEVPPSDDAQRAMWTNVVEAASVGGPLVEAAVRAVAEAAVPHPIAVDTTVTERADGTTLTVVSIDVAANFRVDGGTLPTGQTAEEEAASIEQSIESAFSETYVDADGNEIRYVTDVDMTVNGDGVGREQFVLVDATDPRLDGGLGIAPGFEHGRTAYVSDEAGARTAPHEFGHLAGLRHTAQVDQGCTTAPGINIENLMSQTGCSPTSQQIEQSQLEQIASTPEFQ